MKLKVFNTLIIIFLLALPYYLFEGKLFVGGDDTRLLYSYPFEYLKNVTFFSWYNVSSIGINASNQYLIPLLSILSFIYKVFPSRIVISYFAFSLPLVMGFIYFRKLIKEFFSFKEKDELGIFIGSLFYILSPILIINQLFIFLTTAFLIGLIPFTFYYFLLYLRTNDYKYVYITAIVCLVFSTALISIPWILGLLLPIVCGFIVGTFLTAKKNLLPFFKKMSVFFGFILLTQSFWLIPFASAYFLPDGSSFAQKIVSKGFIDTFTPTVVSTATGNILFPLLNLFHRQIPFDFGWSLKDVFTNLFDKTLILNTVYIVVFMIGVFQFKKELTKNQGKLFKILLFTFVVALFLFTVNIGPLRDFFLTLRFIPGFVMFRNFFDKFALGYVIIYSSLITVCLVVVKKKYKRLGTFLFVATIIVLFLNFTSVKKTVDAPLWGTSNIYRTMTFPEEYMDTMEYIKSHIPSTNSILSVPFGTSIYSVVKDQNSRNIYVGVSPVKIFSGVNDLSGHLSFNFSEEANVIDSLIINKDYSRLSEILYKHNVNFLLLTKNIPQEVFNTWVFDEKMVDAQDDKFIKFLVDKKIYTSAHGNYELYSLKERNTIISGKNISYQKINPTKYRIQVKNLQGSSELKFNDTFNSGWSLFPDIPNSYYCNVSFRNTQLKVEECNENLSLYQGEELLYLFKEQIFGDTHRPNNDLTNAWTINSDVIRENYDSTKYTINPDGSISFSMTMYFVPQSFFYLGVVVSLLSFIAGGSYLLYEKNYKKT